MRIMSMVSSASDIVMCTKFHNASNCINRTMSSNGSVDTDVVNWRDALKGWDDATFKNMDDYEVYNQFSSVV